MTKRACGGSIIANAFNIRLMGTNMFRRGGGRVQLRIVALTAAAERISIIVQIINGLAGRHICGILIASIITGLFGGLGMIDGFVELNSIIGVKEGGMSTEKTCKYCYGTGMIQCTTGWDGEMAVSCSCRQERIEVKENSERYSPTRGK